MVATATKFSNWIYSHDRKEHAVSPGELAAAQGPTT
jgi:hypothetical protein